MAMGTRRTNIPMAMRVQRTGNRPIAASTQYLGDDLDAKAIRLSQQKMTKSQPMRIRPMTTSTRHMNFSPRAETNSYMK